MHPLNYNASIRQSYQQDMDSLIGVMHWRTREGIDKLLPDEESRQEKEKETKWLILLLHELSKEFEVIFNQRGKKISQYMLTRTLKTVSVNIKSNIARADISKKRSSELKQKLKDEDKILRTTKAVVNALQNDNVALTNSIAQQYFKDVTGAVMRTVAYNSPVAELQKQIEAIGATARKRAKVIALNQTEQAYTVTAKKTLEEIGVEKFIWKHTKRGKTYRKSHVEISGLQFTFDGVREKQASLGVPEKDRGLPGECINCHCVMIPIYE